MAIVRVRKDVMLQREKLDMAIVRVCQCVMLQRERLDMAIVRVRKNVTLLRERGDMAILRLSTTFDSLTITYPRTIAHITHQPLPTVMSPTV